MRLERRDPVAMLVGLGVELASVLDLDLEARGQGVDHRHAYAVQPAGDLVSLAAELASGVQHGEHDLDARLPVLGHVVHRDAAAVVDDGYRTVHMDRDVDLRAEAGQGFVDRVVHHLVDEVVESLGPGGPDVHAGAFPDRFQALEDLDVLA
jgi:hypothetical protein